VKKSSFIAASALVLLLAGCSSGKLASSALPTATVTSSGSSTITIDVGNGTPIKVKGPINLAYFAPGANNSWLQAAIRGVKEAIAKVPGATVTVFDAQWDGTKQFNQVQSALQSGRYNAGLIDPVNSKLMCNIVSQDAPKAGMIISNITHPICDKYGSEGEARWTPGTLNYVDANDTVGELKAYAQFIMDQNPGKQKMVTISGPEIDGMTKNVQEAFRQITTSGARPNFNLSNIINTDFSLTQAQSKLTALLQANPDISIIWAPATSDVAQGAYSALKAAGLTGKVKLYEKGGSPWAIQMLSAGQIAGSQPQYPYTEGRIAVEQLASAFAGQAVQRFIPSYGIQYSAVDKARGFAFLDQTAAKNFKSEY